jgi:hypothetical protein
MVPVQSNTSTPQGDNCFTDGFNDKQSIRKALKTDIGEIRSEVYSFVFPKHAHGQTDERPEMQGMPGSMEMFGQVVDLGMAVMAWGNGIVCAGILDLFDLQPPIFTSGIGKARLQESATAAAAVVVGFIWCHVDEIFLADNLFHHVAQIVRHGVSESLSDKLAGILNSEGDFQVLVPV